MPARSGNANEVVATAFQPHTSPGSNLIGRRNLNDAKAKAGDVARIVTDWYRKYFLRQFRFKFSRSCFVRKLNKPAPEIGQANTWQVAES
jgi:hypothetical protein